MSGSVRVRYAPSPTGEPHLGNVRTALFNWLYARHTGGSFILRIEDTDVARRVPEAEAAIFESLRWLGLDWDEGPYYQSQRLPIYREHMERLLARGDAYHCYCSAERLAAMREEQQRKRVPPRYDWLCRELLNGERRESALGGPGIAPVVRFKTPLEGQVSFHDLVHGEVSFDLAVLDDFIILKSDGFPTYHLANVVDDHLMGVTHVLRADEWLPSTPRHLLLYRAFGWEPPQFVHLPMILGPDRAKLSKRHGATSVLEYREQGYLPEAMVNSLALLGWSFDDRTELLSREELIRHFSLERIGKTGAIFNPEKLLWMNGVYLRQLSVEELRDRLLPVLERRLPLSVPRPLDRSHVGEIVPLIQERIKLLGEAVELTDFFFVEPALDEGGISLFLSQRGLKTELEGSALAQAYQQRAAALRAVVAALESLKAFAPATLEGVVRPLAESFGLKASELFWSLRVAVTGRTVAPPLFQSMAVLGRERCIQRLRRAAALLGPPKADLAEGR